MSVQIDQPIEKTSGIRFLWLWGPVVGYCALIFMVSAQQDLSPPDFPSSDKVAHFLEYGVLGLLWARAATASWPYWTFRLLLVSTMLFTGLYGVTDRGEGNSRYTPPHWFLEGAHQLKGCQAVARSDRCLSCLFGSGHREQEGVRHGGSLNLIYHW